MSTPSPARRKSRRGLVLGVILLALFALLTTCVVVAQSNRYTGATGAPADTPRRASLTATSPSAAESSPVNSGPPAIPWRKVHWTKAVQANQIIALHYPPKPSPKAARRDPLRVGVALLGALDSTNPQAWRPGANPLRPYMTPALNKLYTPTKSTHTPEGEDPGAAGRRLPKGGKAVYEFYCHVPSSHAKKRVTVICGYHVRVTTASGTVFREANSATQRLTVRRMSDGWRVDRIQAAGRHGD